MERNDIIKALECCAKGCCGDCPRSPSSLGCCRKTMLDALSLIKELNEENERLRLAFVAECDLSNCTREKETKADTVRKIQKRLKAKAYTNNDCQDVVLLSNIDQIAKEMINNGEKEN